MKKIAVVAGGYSSEYEISLKSAETIVQALERAGYSAFLVIITRDRWYMVDGGRDCDIDRADFSADVRGTHLTFDAAYITIHGTPGEDGILQAYFDMIELPYASCDHLSSTVTFDKWACNAMLKELGFRTAKSVLLRQGETVDTSYIVDKLGLPCFVKPNDGGSSFGITKVKEADALQSAVSLAFNEGDQVLVEGLMEGMEITCGLYKDGTEIIPLPVTELVPDGEFFDYAAKYEGKSQEITPARISDADRDTVWSTCVAIYRKMGLKGLVRIDAFLKDGEVSIIEVNTTPGMTEHSLVPQQAAAAGIDLADLLRACVEGL